MGSWLGRMGVRVAFLLSEVHASVKLAALGKLGANRQHEDIGPAACGRRAAVHTAIYSIPTCAVNLLTTCAVV